MRSILLFLLVCVVAVLPSRRTRAAEPELRIFDVRQLCREVEDRPGPVLSLFESGAVQRERPLQWEVGLGTEEDGAVMGEEDLKMAVERATPKARWDGNGRFLKILHGRLYARNDPAVLDRVERYLKVLEESASVTIKVRALVFGGGVAAPEAEAILNGEEAAALEARVRRGEAWWETISLTAMNGQRAHAWKGTQFLHLAEIDPNVASGAEMSDPVMAVGDLGVVLDARTLVSPSGASFAVTLRVSCARAGPAPEIRTVETPGGRIQVPEVRHTALEATVRVPKGKALLLGTSKAAGTGKAPSRGGVRILLSVETCGRETEKTDASGR
jgi:hypothetical protein